MLESFGLPLIEAAQFGIPVLASDLPYVHQVITPSIVFDPYNHIDIAEKILLFKQHKYEKTELKIESEISKNYKIIKKMKIIVLGGNGFIGKNLIKNLLTNKSNSIISVDKDNINLTNLRLKSHTFNLENYSQLEPIILKFVPDLIINTAAKCDIEGTNVEDYSINYELPKNIIKTINSNPNFNPLVLSFLLSFLLIQLWKIKTYS